MEPERWQRIKALFEGALDLPTAERSAFLDRAGELDDELRAEVEDMLRAEAAGSGIGGSIGRAIEVVEEDEPIPDRIGPYRVKGEIGRGGLSTVLLGERDDDEYRMQVAIKLVRRGLDTGDLLRRLRQERQILARLDHPNIARLLDGGSTEHGRPYVVMERIEGDHIDLYCRRHRLSLEQRLRLFGRVCDAVAFAHRNLVIHRDIKPANILVTADGQPKLLDFGIAKLLRPDQHDPVNAALTVPGLRLLTPEYASPEQVRGEALTTVTDVYSLGALLYELLVGERPHRLEGRDAESLERVICEQDPESPSTRARRLEAAPGEAELCPPDPTPPISAGRLKGDLDTIVLAALRREPERRYPSVVQLAEDIERYLAIRPIRARRDTWPYRVGKLVRRHRAAVLGSALLIAVLVTATLVTSRQALIAQQQRQHAEAQSARTEKISELLVGIFKVSDPSEARGNTITAREILDRAAARLADELDGQPEDQAALAETMGRVYKGLGLYKPAHELFTASLELRRSLWGDEHAEVAGSLNHLGATRFEQGRFEESLELIERALEIRRRVLGDEHAATLDSLNDVAALRFHLGDYEQAAELFRLNLEMRQRILGDEHDDVAEALDNLATVLLKTGRSTEAEQRFRRALDLRIRLHGENHPAVVKTRGNLATLLDSAGRTEEAEPLYRRVLKDQLRLLGPDHTSVADTSANLAALLRDRGDDEEAEALLIRAIEIDRLRRGAGNIHVSYKLVNLADLLRLRNRTADLDRAEQLYHEALHIRQKALRVGHPDLAAPLAGLARTELTRLYLARIEADREPAGTSEMRSPEAIRAVAAHALKLAEQASDILRTTFDENHPEAQSIERLLKRCQEVANSQDPLQTIKPDVGDG